MCLAMVGMARCAVPARVVAGGTYVRATQAFEAIAPLHAARTSQRDVPTLLNRYQYVFGVKAEHTLRVVCSEPPTRRNSVVVLRLNDGRKRIPKSRQGRPKVAHGFNRGLRVEIRQSPGGAKESIGVDRRVLSSLTGLVSYSRHNPAMNRWAYSRASLRDMES